MTWTWKGGKAIARIPIEIPPNTRINDVLARLKLPEADDVEPERYADSIEVKVFVRYGEYVVWYSLYDRSGDRVDMRCSYYRHPVVVAYPENLKWIEDAHIRQLLEAKMAEAQL